MKFYKHLIHKQIYFRLNYIMYLTMFENNYLYHLISAIDGGASTLTQDVKIVSTIHKD